MKEIYIETKAVNKGHYVPGIISKGVLYVSGQLPMNHETGVMENGDISAQARMALHNVDLVLRAAGTSRDLVNMCRVYIPDMEESAEKVLFSRVFSNNAFSNS